MEDEQLVSVLFQPDRPCNKQENYFFLLTSIGPSVVEELSVSQFELEDNVQYLNP